MDRAGAGRADEIERKAAESGEPTDRRERIIAAAYELIDEAGLDGLTVRAVLGRTGLARRAFYECFEGKDALVLALFRGTLRDAADLFGKLAGELDDPVETIRLIVQSIALAQQGGVDPLDVHYDMRAAAFSREHLRLAEARPDELQDALSPLLDLIAGQVKAGVASGQLRPCDPHLQARLIYNIVSTTVHTELLTDGESSSGREREVLADAVWTFCERAIRA